MKKSVRSIVFFIALFVSCSFIIPAQLGTLESHAASKVKISKTKATITKGKTLQLKMKGTKKKVKWSSSKKSVAIVSSKGKVNAKTAGKATITAKIGKKKYRCKVTVKNPPVVKISNTRATILEGETLKLEMFGTKNKVKWYSSNKSIATVNKYGRVSAKKPGKATITAKIEKKAYRCNLTVDAHRAEILVDFSAAKNEMFFMTVKYTDKYGTHVAISNQQRNRSDGDEYVMMEGSGTGEVIVTFDNVVVLKKKVVFR